MLKMLKVMFILEMWLKMMQVTAQASTVTMSLCAVVGLVLAADMSIFLHHPGCHLCNLIVTLIALAFPAPP